MGDRTPIMFGPEWLRNLALEQRSSSTSASNMTNAGMSTTTSGATGASLGGISSATSSLGQGSGTGASRGGSASSAGGKGGTTSSGSRDVASRSTFSRIMLAKLRYGREEMLALYDKDVAEVPLELKQVEMLYQPRYKPPGALNNNFEHEMRDNMRGSSNTVSSTLGERGIGRGRGILSLGDSRGRPRMPFARSLSTGRGLYREGNSRLQYPGYNTGIDEDSVTSLRPWNSPTNDRNSGNTNLRNGEMLRNKRPGNTTNWRQPQREDEEWRLMEKSRSGQDKRDRDWGDKPSQEKQSWGPNRRPWGDHEENLPEWAVGSAEACAGSFDFSGNFLGYSHDDNIPTKLRESTFRTGTADTSAATNSGPVKSTSKEDSASAEPTTPAKMDKPSGSSDPPDSVQRGDSFEKTAPVYTTQYSENKSYELLRSDMNLEENNDERSNFQSVMLPSNNSLRQKHQHLVQPSNKEQQPSNQKDVEREMAKQEMHLYKELSSFKQSFDNENPNQHTTKQTEDNLVEEFLDISLADDRKMINNSSANMGSGMAPMGNIQQMSNSYLPLGLNTSLSSTVMNNVMLSNSVMTSVSSQCMTSDSGISEPVMLNSGISNPGLVLTNSMLSNQGLTLNSNQMLSMPDMQNASMAQTNNALNASLGLPLRINNPVNNSVGMVMPLPGVRPQMVPTQGGMSSFPSNSGLPGMSNSDMVNNSLFLGQNTNISPQQMPTPNDIVMPSHGVRPTMYNNTFNSSSLYSNMIQQTSNMTSLSDQWYYEDPKKVIQGPFSSREMYSWYRAGFFNSTLLVGRACDTHMRPLGSYGPFVPFEPMDMMTSYHPIANAFDVRLQGPRGALGNVLNMSGMSNQTSSAMDQMQFGMMRNPTPGQPQQMAAESYWGQSPDMQWMQQTMNRRTDNTSDMMFWDEQQSSVIASNSRLPEDIAKEMKTEDEILAQLRATQNLGPAPPQSAFERGQVPATSTAAAADEQGFVNATPNMEELQKLISKEPVTAPTPLSVRDNSALKQEQQTKAEKQTKVEPILQAVEPTKVQPSPVKPNIEQKQQKQTKTESEKATKNKDNHNAKNKSKNKSKEDKKDEPVADTKNKEGESMKAKRSQETSPAKTNKKEEKQNKKELEKEKKEWIKEGFTIVKGAEKTGKEGKKKSDETKTAEEVERKRKDEEKLAIEEEKKKKQAETARKQQEQQLQPKQAIESAARKAPWSAFSGQGTAPSDTEGLSLAEIQRLEKEKKLEQMKEQQQMIQLIAQQQAAAIAREQEMQAGLGWAKKKANTPTQGQSLAEIQAEARKAVAASAAQLQAQAQLMDEARAPTPPHANHVPWGNSHNGGFWDTQPKTTNSKPSERPEPPKPVEQPKNKKKSNANIRPKKETSPAAEFESWCAAGLGPWSSSVDVPTFIGFLKDIESPYEVKDYVKCYLGESKESSDFARQFLEKRSKLLRVGTVTPSDDLCSPAAAINPRAATATEYQESKAKKSKKNKMQKVDARILGFSVTAAEDRINVGDIDTV